jgi:hypothetical protein
LTVSVDFQLSVLEEVAVLLRTAASFLVIVDQLSQLGDSHKYRREICQSISHRSMDDGGWLVWGGFGLVRVVERFGSEVMRLGCHG